MSRKWMVMVAVAALVLVAVQYGCRKPAPVTPEVVEPAPEPVAPAPKEVPEPVAPPPPDEPEWYEDADLRRVSDEANRRGYLGDVYFDFDKYDLKPEARDRLAKNAAFMKEHPEFTFTIEGHCDERGTNEYNLALGERRASAASGYISSLGVSGGAMKTISYGEERPTCAEHSESCWQRNRRAHFVITGRSAG